MAIMSLAEAKAELEQQEQEQAPEQKPEKRETLKLPEKQEPEETPEDDEQAPSESSEGETASDDWMKGDEEESDTTENEPDTGKLSDAQAAKIRRKFQGRLKAEKDESEKLREENAELQRKLQAAANAKPAATTTEPKREQFRTDDEFQKALTIHLLDERDRQRQAENAAAEHKQQVERARTTINQNVEAHYTRRAELAKKSNISEEAMGSAEQAFRQAIDDIRPGMGDAITDGLISMLGKGSEMVIHKLGVSRAAREKAAEALRNDPSGLGLAAYLGELKASLTAPMKRVSNAPEPPPQIQGDKTNNSAHGRLMKEYDAAEKSGDSQRIWNARKALKAKGIDVSKL